MSSAAPAFQLAHRTKPQASIIQIEPNPHLGSLEAQQFATAITTDWVKYRHQKWPAVREAPMFAQRYEDDPVVTANTAITSMGSCFADNIAKYLSEHNFNYLVTEQPFQYTSAHWNQVQNTACMRQIFEYSFTDNWRPVERWWQRGEVLQDPYRGETVYVPASADQEFAAHRQASRQALSQAEIIILTLGLVEVWRNRQDQMTFYMVPSPRVYDPAVHEFYVQNSMECLRDLNRIHELAVAHNPGVHFIVTVSPIPLYATFRQDVSVMQANSYSKATLRVAAELFAYGHRNVHYFPAYEMITQCLPDPWDPSDGRHPTATAVAEVMATFRARYVTT